MPSAATRSRLGSVALALLVMHAHVLAPARAFNTESITKVTPSEGAGGTLVTIYGNALVAPAKEPIGNPAVKGVFLGADTRGNGGVEAKVISVKRTNDKEDTIIVQAGVPTKLGAVLVTVFPAGNVEPSVGKGFFT